MSGREDTAYNGFWSRVGYGLKEKPETAGDIVSYVEMKANFPVDFIHASEDQAWADAERDLKRQARIALMHIDSLPGLSRQKYTPAQIEEWSRAAEKNLSIAGTGLQFCEARKKK